MSVPKYTLFGYTEIQPVFNQKNKYFVFIKKMINKDGTVYFICQKKANKCKATATKQLDGTFIMNHRHICQGSTESQILVKIHTTELEKKVLFFVFMVDFLNATFSNIFFIFLRSKICIISTWATYINFLLVS